MITAKLNPVLIGFAARLAQKAQVLAESHAEEAIRGKRHDAGRWRKAALLWPLFTKG